MHELPPLPQTPEEQKRSGLGVFLQKLKGILRGRQRSVITTPVQSEGHATYAPLVESQERITDANAHFEKTRIKNAKIPTGGFAFPSEILDLSPEPQDDSLEALAQKGRMNKFDAKYVNDRHGRGDAITEVSEKVIPISGSGQHYRVG